jgi:hypothetical protein
MSVFMRTINYSIIDPYPVEDISESDLANPNLRILYPNRIRHEAKNAFQHACLVANGQSKLGLDIQVASFLQQSSHYTDSVNSNDQYRASMLSKYRDSYRSFEDADAEDLNVLEAANQELLMQGRCLAAGQTLFHGGSWPSDADGNPLARFVSSRIVSTTLMANVAQWHADQHIPKEIWVITVAPNSSAKGYIFRPDGFLGHEFEIAIAAGAVFERVHETQCCNASVLQVALL